MPPLLITNESAAHPIIKDTVEHSYDEFEEPKILYSSVVGRGFLTLDEKGVFADKTCYFIPSADKYLLGVLNSTLLFFYFSNIAVEHQNGF